MHHAPCTRVPHAPLPAPGTRYCSGEWLHLTRPELFTRLLLSYTKCFRFRHFGAFGVAVTAYIGTVTPGLNDAETPGLNDAETPED